MKYLLVLITFVGCSQSKPLHIIDIECKSTEISQGLYIVCPDFEIFAKKPRSPK
jgi:hypothetical protein